MSTRSALAAVSALCLVATTGCWEQIDDGAWFPQMKRQIAIQAYEDTGVPDHPQGFSPPEGTFPVDAAPVLGLDAAETDLLENPVGSDLRSLENGRDQYETFCATCHGDTGLANGPVARVFPGVLPLVGVVRARTDGHIYSTITHGRRRMPNYSRIPAKDRWDVVNYVRYLDEKGGRP